MKLFTETGVLSCDDVLVDRLQMTNGLDAITAAIRESLFGQQDNVKTQETPRPSLGGKCQTDTSVCPTPTGRRVSRTTSTRKSHASICGKDPVIPGMTSRAAVNTASSARTSAFQSDHPTETMA